MKTKRNPVLGVDFGNTIAVHDVPIPDSLRVLGRLAKEVFDGRVFIISKVNEEQEIRVRRALKEHAILDILRISIDEVRFCPNRADKATICRELGVTHMIDDRPEVMVGMPEVVTTKILMDPDFDDLLLHFNRICPVTLVRNWKDVEGLFFPKA